MAIFTETVTYYQYDAPSGDYRRFVLRGVQWSDHYEKTDNDGRISVSRYATVTIPAKAADGIEFPVSEFDAMFLGVVGDMPKDERGKRISDMLTNYQRAGRVKTVNDNRNGRLLPHVKVTLA